MKSLFILTSALLFTANVLAENDPLWMRYPAISPNGETIAFTYKGDIYTVPANGGKATQLTTHPAHDTRPIWSPDGSKIAFASDRNGNFDIFVMDKEGVNQKQIYTVKEGAKPQKVDVRIISDKVENDLIHQLKTSGATDIAVSPNGKEIAFIVRGDVYVTSVDYETTKQITNTPQQERDLDFSPDGRSLVYSAERGETWGVYQSSLVRKVD